MKIILFLKNINKVSEKNSTFNVGFFFLNNTCVIIKSEHCFRRKHSECA
jgi:hypothetical protein